ncbi:MAG: hypothetical protein LC624_02095 [Halobacteriales archaeon]|nr:hypothetical protein [Halobacteriales archaeon]
MRLGAVVGVGLVVATLLASPALALGTQDVLGAAQDGLDAVTAKTGTDDIVAQAGGTVLGDAFGALQAAQDARNQALQDAAPVVGDPMATARAALATLPSSGTVLGALDVLDRAPGLLAPVQGDVQAAEQTVDQFVQVSGPLALAQRTAEERAATTLAFAQQLAAELTAP